jgi:CO/xanthine dehydrogenase FAD-binding subunit
VKPPPFEYARPTSLDEALALLADHGDEAKVLAGGQSLMPLLTMRLARPALLVDINDVGGLDNVDRDGAAARVGALVRQTTFVGVCPLGDLCLPHVGHFVTRNRGTVCGSIAHGDARAELPVALVALGGSVVAASQTGRRTIAAPEFFLTHFTTALRPDELVVETVWPDSGPGWGWAFEEVALRAGDYALAMVAAAVRTDGARVTRATVALGATVDRPTLLPEVASIAIGEAVDDRLAREAGAMAAAAVQPSDGLHATAAYQRHLTAVLVERGLLTAWRAATERA